MLLERKQLLVPDCALCEKRKNTLFWRHVKTANFKQNWNLRCSKQQKYIKLIVVVV